MAKAKKGFQVSAILDTQHNPSIAEYLSRSRTLPPEAAEASERAAPLSADEVIKSVQMSVAEMDRSPGGNPSQSASYQPGAVDGEKAPHPPGVEPSASPPLRPD